MLALCLLCALTPASAASPEGDRALEILDSRTAAHWGEDNWAWVVHYPERLVDPWVKSEAARRKLSAAQTEQFRKAFADELKAGDATAVMLSVHAFGATPLKLAPLAQNVALITPSGKRIQPMVYEKKLDNPISGLMQGFVFFPLQRDENFRIAVRGLVPERETLFAFGASAGPAIATTPIGGARRPQGGPARPDAEPPQDVVVKIPTTKPPVAPTPPKAPAAKSEEPEFSLSGETFPPTAPPAPPADEAAASADAAPPAAAEARQNRPVPKEQPGAAFVPRQTLDTFLKSWIRGDTDGMYELLSEESRAGISKELFEKDVLGGGFRQGLRDGYKITWEGESAKVTVSRKILLMRTLNSRRFDFVEENGAARIAW